MTESNNNYTENLTLLKKSQQAYPDNNPDHKILESFDNRYSDRGFWVTFDCPEFTTRCPITNQPDFGKIIISYIPNKKCIESKSLKLYLFSFRNFATFHEESINKIRDDLVTACSPHELVVEGLFNARGGISIAVKTSFKTP